jgi:hypothetical protein
MISALCSFLAFIFFVRRVVLSPQNGTALNIAHGVGLVE